MEDRFNTIAGWTLFAGIVALGASSLSSHYFEADKDHRPEKMGYEIEGVVASDAGAGPVVPLETLLASADPAKGEAVFKKCASCHTINQGGPNGIGPNLYGVVGEEIGKGKAGYAFSPDLASHEGTWDFATLDKWLTSPKKFANGTKMTFAGLSSGEDRANVIVYLNSQGSNKPLPVAAAPVAAPSAGATVPTAGSTAAPSSTASGAPADTAPTGTPTATPRTVTPKS